MSIDLRKQKEGLLTPTELEILVDLLNLAKSYHSQLLPTPYHDTIWEAESLIVKLILRS